MLEYDAHRGMQQWARDLNRLYRDQPALHRLDVNSSGFEWVDCHDWEGSSLSFLRKSARPEDGTILCVYNYTPVVRENYRVGVPCGGFWRELLNSDAPCYWGSGVGNAGGRQAEEIGQHGRPWSINLTLPPLSALFFRGG